MKHGKVLSVFIPAFLIGCVSNSPSTTAGQANPFEGVSPAVRDRIAECSGGMKIDVALEAKIARDLTKSASLSAGVKNEIQGAIFAKVSEANAAAAYKDYVACVERHRSM